MASLQTLEIDRIRLPEGDACWRTDARCDRESIEALRRALQVTGWIQPIIVRKVGDGFELLDGLRRLESARADGRPTIDAIVLDGDVALPGIVAYLLHEGGLRPRPIESARLAALARADLASRAGEATQATIGDLLGVNQSTVSRHLEVADALPPRLLRQHDLNDSDLARLPLKTLAAVAAQPADVVARVLKGVAELKREGSTSNKIAAVLPKLLPAVDAGRTPYTLACRGDGRVDLHVRRREMSPADAAALLARLGPLLLDLMTRADIESLERLRELLGASEATPALRIVVPTNRGPRNGTGVGTPSKGSAYATRMTRRKFLSPRHMISLAAAASVGRDGRDGPAPASHAGGPRTRREGCVSGVHWARGLVRARAWALRMVESPRWRVLGRAVVARLKRVLRTQATGPPRN